MAAYRRVDGFKSPAVWLPVHWDQLWSQRSVTSMGELYFLAAADVVVVSNTTTISAVAFTSACWHRCLPIRCNTYARWFHGTWWQTRDFHRMSNNLTMKLKPTTTSVCAKSSVGNSPRLLLVFVVFVVIVTDCFSYDAVLSVTCVFVCVSSDNNFKTKWPSR